MRVSRWDSLWLALFCLVIVYHAPVFRLAFFNNVIEGYTYSDLLINYSAGFVRRGLLGEIVRVLVLEFGCRPIRVFSWIFLALASSQVMGVFYLLRQYSNKPLLLTIIALSPALLLFTAYNIELPFRKEMFIISLMVLHAIVNRIFLQGMLRPPAYRQIVMFVIVPLLAINILIYETQLFFLPRHLIFTWIAYRFNRDRNIKLPVSILASYCLVLPSLAASIIAHGNADMASTIRQSVEGWSGTESFGAIQNLGLSFKYGMSAVWTVIHNAGAMIKFPCAFVLSVILPVIIYRRAMRQNQFIQRWMLVAHLDLHLCLIVGAALPLFVFSLDFGRWMHLIAMSITLYFLQFPYAAQNFGVVGNATPVRLSGLSKTRFFLATIGIAMYTSMWRMPISGVNPPMMVPAFIEQIGEIHSML